MTSDLKLIRYSQENPNIEALKGKYGYVGESWGSVTVFKNMVLVVANKGAKVSDYRLPEVYDGFVICSDSSIVNIENSTLNLDLEPDVCAQGTLKLVKDN